jgi:hypothetical protein
MSQKKSKRHSAPKVTETKEATPDKTGLWGWPTDRWIAFAAVVIASCSLFITVTEWRASRQHARISAQPRLSYTYFYNDDGAGWRRSNNGLGTARLRGFRMLVDGEPVRGFIELWQKFEVPFPPDFQFTNPYVGIRYRPGLDNILLWANPGPTATFLKKSWKRVVFQSCYCSLYGECWAVSSDGSLRDADGEHKRDDNCSLFRGQETSRWWKG